MSIPYYSKLEIDAKFQGYGGGGPISAQIDIPIIAHNTAHDIDIPAVFGLTDQDAMDNYGFFIDMRLASASDDLVRDHFLFLHALGRTGFHTGEIDTVSNDVGQAYFSGGIVLGSSHPTYVRIRIPVGGLRASGICWDVVWGAWDNRTPSYADQIGSPNNVTIPSPIYGTGGTPTVYPTLQRAHTAGGNHSNSSTGDIGSKFDAGSDAMGLTSFTLDMDTVKLRLFASIAPYNTSGQKIAVEKFIITPFK